MHGTLLHYISNFFHFFSTLSTFPPPNTSYFRASSPGMPILFAQLFSSLTFNTILTPSWYLTIHIQHSTSSCLTSLLDFYAQVIDTYDTDNNKEVDLVYLDCQKAFDKVPHERLILKINSHGIQGNAAKLIRNWLAGDANGYASTNPIVTGHQSHVVSHKVVYYASYYFLHNI